VALRDEDDTADLDEAPVGSLNNSFAHCDGDLMSCQPVAQLQYCTQCLRRLMLRFRSEVSYQ
jgi:hypothetical protein